MDIGIKENYINQLNEEILSILLKDRSSGKNIIWATDIYAFRGVGYQYYDYITINVLTDKFGEIIKPRTKKNKKEQQIRVKDKAEVFSPSWICNKMANYLDNEYFHKENLFNIEKGTNWETNKNKISFSKLNINWQDYVTRKGLEITCGEAPFLVSRYDTVTGKWLEPINRIGILDRKIRIINENIENEKEWIEWIYEAYKATYGYEWQGDSLLIAREILLFSFIDYYIDKFKKFPLNEYLLEIAKIISWNIWQMDGLKYVIPNSCKPVPKLQLSFFEEEMEPCPSCLKGNNNHHTGIYCKIMNWTTKTATKFYKGDRKMKFDFIIGNPPYQENTENTSDKPIYNYFMDAAYAISDKVELITPARFLFNAGKTPKSWNKKMLEDEHLKVLKYIQKSSYVFPNTDIKGGVCITYKDKKQNFGKIGIFTSQQELLQLANKIIKNKYHPLSNIVYAPESYKFTQIMHKENPQIANLLSDGHENDITSNIFDKLGGIVFFDKKPEDSQKYVQIYGRKNNIRKYMWINIKYIKGNINFDKWKVFLPASNGSGAIGEILSTPLVGTPLVGHTQTFLSIGSFENQEEAENCLKYIKCKFTRAMLGVLKITQSNKKEVWKYVPIQDFTSNSDIDWSKSIPEIDQQLYNKYGLNQEEITFIESHVKEMK